jgi:hypothetical protein
LTHLVERQAKKQRMRMRLLYGNSGWNPGDSF